MAATPQGDRVEGLGTAGAPVGLVLTVQGPGAGGAVPVDTELPAAVAMSDGLATTPLLPAVQAFLTGLNVATGFVERLRVAGIDGQVTGILAGAPHLLNPAGTYDIARGDKTAGLRTSPVAAILSQSANSAANATLTLTLGAAGAGLFHYITHVRLTRSTTAAVVGSAILNTTTTNLNGRIWQFGNAIVVGGTVIDADQEFAHPLRAAVANTVTTIVIPACGAAVVSSITVDFYTAP